MAGTGKAAEQTILPQDEKSRRYAWLAYLPFVWIFSFFARPKDAFVRFHAKQGMKLTGLICLIGAAGWALNALISWLFSYQIATPTAEDLSHVTTGVNQVGQTLCIVVAFSATVLCVAYFLFGVIHAARGKTKILPLPHRRKTEKTQIKSKADN